MNTELDENLCLLLDGENQLLGHAELESPPEEDVLLLRLQPDVPDNLEDHGVLRIISQRKRAKVIQSYILQRRGDRVKVERLSFLDPELRRSLRVPVSFASFVYPISGKWKGRKPIQSVDLSCGGIAFYGDESLKEQEIVEVVVPVTTQPLILRAKILRKEPLGNSSYVLYAAKFVDFCNDEESMVMEAVFSLQLEGRPESREEETQRR